MRLHYMRAEALGALKIDLKSNPDLYKRYSKADNKWLDSYFKKRKISQPFGEINLDISYDFSLPFDAGKSESENDVDAAVALYSALQGLSDADAADERLWAGLCHKDFYSYLNKRWGKTKEPKFIQSRFFFGQGIHRSEFTNSFAKLWWVGRLTYDQNNKDPFEYTKYLKNGLIGTGRVTLFSNSFCASHEILIGLIMAHKKLGEDGYNIFPAKDVMVLETKYLNRIGGTFPLDFYDRYEICEMVFNHIKDKCPIINE